MNLKKLFFMLTFFVLLGTITFAQTDWYVNATNGLDVGFTGTSELQPYKTIANVFLQPTYAAGDIIHVSGDTYTEAIVTVTKAVTFVGYVDPTVGATTVMLKNGLDVNPGAGKTVSVGLTGQPWQIGEGATPGVLTLTSGSLAIATANFILIPTLVTTINVVDGTINEAPTFSATATRTDLNYTPAANRSTGFEMPASCGNFTLNAAGVVLTTDKVFTARLITVTAGTLDLAFNATASTVGATAGIVNTGTIKVNSNTLTLTTATAGPVTPRLGTIISTLAGTAGSGYFVISGSQAITPFIAPVVLPNFTIPSTYTGVFTTTGNINVDGTFTLSSAAAGAFTFGGPHTLQIMIDFLRNDNTLGNFVPLTGVVSLVGTTNTLFNPGAQLTVYDFNVNKTVATVTLIASFTVSNNFTITTGNVELSNFNIHMTGATALFTNGGAYYSTTNNGYLAFEGAAGTVTGTGYFGNMLINLSAAVTGTNFVISTSNIEFSGTLYVNKGWVGPGNTFRWRFMNYFTNNPLVKINTTVLNNAKFTTDPANLLGVGIVGIISGVVTLDLYYFGTGNYAAADEWGAVTATELNDVTIATTGGNTVTGFNGASTIDGILTVNTAQTLAQGAGNVYTLSGNGLTHNISGTVTGGALRITSTGAYLNGPSTVAGAAVINDLTVQTAAGGTFFSNNLKSVNTITMLQGTASINLFTDAVPTGVTHLGNVVINAGTLIYNLGNAGKTTGGGIAGNVTMTGGKLQLASRFPVVGNVSHTGDAIIDLQNYNMLVTGNYTHNNTASFLTGTGVLYMVATSNVVLTTALSIPNFGIDSPAGIVTLTTNDLTVSNAFYLTDGTFDLGGLDLIITGNTFDWDVTTPAVFDDSGPGSTVQLKGAALVVTALDPLGGALNADFNGLTADVAVEVNSTGTVTFTFLDDGTSTFLNFIVGNAAFTQTAGDIVLTDVHLELQGSFTRVAGNWSMTSYDYTTGDTGLLIFNLATPAVVTGTGFAVDNLEVKVAYTTAVNNKSYTVNKVLLLTAGAITQGVNGKLTLGDNALIVRNAGNLVAAPVFGANINLAYIGAVAAQNTGFEWPANATSLVQNVTVNHTGGADIVTIGATPRQVNGVLYLQKGHLSIATASTLVLASGATLQLTSIGWLDRVGTGAFTTTTYNLVYSGAGNIVANTQVTFGTGEWPASTTKILSVTVNMGTALLGVTLDGSKTLNTDLNLTKGFLGFDAATGGVATYFTLSVKGNVSISVNGSFLLATARTAADASRPTLKLNGAAAQTVTVPAAGFSFPNGNDVTADGDFDDITDIVPFNLVVDNTEGVVLSTGSLNMGWGSVVYFTNGSFETGAGNFLKLWHDGNIATNTADQGFVRTNGDVVGNVKKNIDKLDLVAISNVQFPVGTKASSPIYYRPATFFFTTAPQTSFDLTVAHNNVSPGGSNGIIPNGLIGGSGVIITNYPDFSWYVKSSQQIAPSYKYDVEFQGEGYLYYEYDQIEDMRLIRRDSGNVANEWRLQGTGIGDYDNSTINNDQWPVVKVILATGGLTIQGSIFTYSQSNKAPMFTAALAATSIAEDSLFTFTYHAMDPDIGQSATYSLVAPADTAGKHITFNNTTGVFTFHPSLLQAGTYTVTVRATDPFGLTTDTTAVITVTDVNAAPVFTAEFGNHVMKPAATPAEFYTYQFAATDADTDNTLTFSIVSTVGGPANAATITAAGLFKFQAAAADDGKTFIFTVGVNDGTVTVNSVDTIQVVANRAPVFVDVMPAQTISTGDTLTFTYTATDPDGDSPLAFAFDGQVPEGMTINSVTGKLFWVAAGNQSGILLIKVKVTDPQLAVGRAQTELTVNFVVSVLEQLGIPTEYTLKQNYPNPFNPSTIIRFGLPTESNVVLKVFNILGQEVATLLNGTLKAGYHEVNFNASQLTSGLYIYRIQSKDFVSVKKMMLMK